MPTAPAAPSRPVCSIFIATSVDGYIARSNGGVDFLDCVQAEGEDYGYAEFFASVDALVMGRNTYETVLGFGTWPYAGKRVFVATHRPASSRHGEQFFEGAPGPLLRRLQQEGVRRIYVDGGVLIGQFLAEGLIDELTISIVPVVLGGGIRLFSGGEGEHRFELVQARSYGSGLVQLRYKAA